MRCVGSIDEFVDEQDGSAGDEQREHDDRGTSASTCLTDVPEESGRAAGLDDDDDNAIAPAATFRFEYKQQQRGPIFGVAGLRGALSGAHSALARPAQRSADG